MTGSMKKATIDGETYSVVQDADVSLNPSKTVESVTHSGGNDSKVTLSDSKAESVTLKLSLEEYKALDDRQGEQGIPLSLEYADGSVITGPGFFGLDSYTSQDGKADITFYPDTVWEVFGA